MSKKSNPKAKPTASHPQVAELEDVEMSVQDAIDQQQTLSNDYAIFKTIEMMSGRKGLDEQIIH